VAESPVDPVRIGVVGLGYWGPNVARNFADAEGAVLRTLVDVDTERLAASARRYPGARATPHLAEALADPELDAVAIATPAATHAKLAAEALRTGKHVLVEKPMAFSAAEARALTDLARREGRVLMVGHTYVYNPALATLKAAMRAPDFGPTHYVYATRVNLGRMRGDVNVVWNLAPHDVSILLELLEERPVAVTAQGKAFLQDGIEDVAFVFIEFPSGAVAHVHVSWVDPSKVRRVTVVGAGGMAVFDDLASEARVKVYERGSATSLATDGGPRDYEVRLRAGDIRIPRVPRTEPLAAECAHFLACIRSGETPRSSGEDGLAVVEVLEAAQRSLETGGARVPLEAPDAPPPPA